MALYFHDQCQNDSKTQYVLSGKWWVFTDKWSVTHFCPGKDRFLRTKFMHNTQGFHPDPTKLAHWYKHVEDAGYDSFQVVKQTIYENYIDILNFFDNRSTNASAESFNAKIKNFRAQLRGISDVKYFLFRLQKIYA